MSTEELHPASQGPESVSGAGSSPHDAPPASESSASSGTPSVAAAGDIQKPKARAGKSAKSSAPVQRWYGTGRRKESVARVYLTSGSGAIRVNKQSFEGYFPRETLRMLIEQPLKAISSRNKFDVTITVDGGGIAGQAGAARLGISRALLKYDETNRPTLRKAGYLTRDPRARERKKFGQRGARRRFQWTKR